jgi:hypothetical protein
MLVEGGTVEKAKREMHRSQVVAREHAAGQQRQAQRNKQRGATQPDQPPVCGEMTHAR